MPMTHRRGAQEGYSLIELLVVMVIFGIVGTIIVGSLARGAQADREAQARIEAFEDMQIALERVSRNVRAASMPLLEADPVNERLQLRLLRDGICSQFTYWVDADALRVREERSTTEECTFSSASETLVVGGLEPGSNVFTFESDEYFRDANDDLQRETASSVDEIQFVTISFTRAPVGQPVTVQTVVGLRNTTS